MDKQKSDTLHCASAVILVVDDDPPQREILRVILTDEGYNTHVASSAEEALTVAHTLKPDIVLTDLRMYKVDGIKLMEKLRSQADAPEVIIMSAFSTPLIIEEAARKGACSFMQKTLDIPQVSFNIKRALAITTKLKHPDRRS